MGDGHRARCRIEGREAVAGADRDGGGHRRSAWRDRGRAQFGADPDPRLGPVGPGRAGQDRHHPVDGLGEIQLARHGTGEVGQGLVRRSPRAVDQAVREQLGAAPQRLEQQGDRDRRGDREHRAAAVAHERPDAEHDAGVHPGGRGREQPVDHGAADNDVDVVQPVHQDREGHRGRDAEQRDELHGGVGDRGQPGLAVRQAQQGDKQADEEPHGREGEPLDLQAQPPTAGPVPNGQRDERGRQEREEHRREPVHRTDQDRAQNRPEITHGQRVREAERGPAGSGERHQPRVHDQANRGQGGQRQAGRRHRPPAPRRQHPGREEQEHERHREDDGGKLHSASVPTCLAAGSDPGNVLSPISAYTDAIARNAWAAPAPSMIQPMTLPARWTMRAPSVA